MPLFDFDFYHESEVELSDLESYIAKGFLSQDQDEDEAPQSYPERIYHLKPMAPDFRNYQYPFPEQHYTMQDEEEDYFPHY